MSILEWQERARLSPEKAAAELLRRVATLPPAQVRAIWAWLPQERDLVRAFSEAREGPLRGVPFAVKDLYPVRGIPTLAGGRLSRPLVPATDAALVRQLHASGAVLAGKTHLHEFAYGLTGENPHYGNVAHPRFPDRTSGGSSSGSAAAVAAGIVPFALGTDTGGSIRLPAAFCGLYGLRLTPHHVWINDAFPLAPGFDTPGWFTSSAADLRLINRTLLGPTRDHPTLRGASLAAANLSVAMEVHDAKLLREAAERLAPPADNTTADALAIAFQHAPSAYAILQSIEAYQVHSASLDAERSHYGEAVWARIDRGRRWTSEQIADARMKAQLVRDAWTQFFQSYDFLVMPATPSVALRHDDLGQARRDAQLALTTPASLAGLPVVTLPVPRPDGLTLGLQVVVPSFTSPAIDAVLRSWFEHPTPNSQHRTSN